MNTTTQSEELVTQLSHQLGMRIGARYVVTRESKHREFKVGDQIWMDPDGAISCQAAQGWMPAEAVPAATEGWAIEIDTNWAEKERERLQRQIEALHTLKR